MCSACYFLLWFDSVMRTLSYRSLLCPKFLFLILFFNYFTPFFIDSPDCTYSPNRRYLRVNSYGGSASLITQQLHDSIPAQVAHLDIGITIPRIWFADTGEPH